MKIHGWDTKICNNNKLLIEIGPKQHISCSSRVSTCSKISYCQDHSGHRGFDHPSCRESSCSKRWRYMIDEICRSCIDTSRQFEYADILIEGIFFIYFFHTWSSCRCRKRDKSISFLHLDIHMCMRSCSFMKESSSYILMCDDPLLRYRIDRLLYTSTIHIVHIRENTTSKKECYHRHHYHELKQGESSWWISKCNHKTLLSCDTHYLHDSSKYGNSKPKYKNSC